MKSILHIFSTLATGGYQQRFLSLAERTDQSVQHIVFAMDGNYDALKAAPVSVQRLDIHPFEKNSLLKSITAARKHLKQLKPHLVLTYNWGAVEWALAARLSGINYCTVQDGFGTDEQTEELPRRRFVRRIAMHGAKAVIVPSVTLADRAKRSWGIKPPRLRVIPNGIDVKRFNCEPDTDLLKKAGIGPDDKVAVIVAALRPEKNVGRLIEAFRTVVDTHETAKLLIVGDGVGRAPLTMLTERIDLTENVIFLGEHKQPEKILAGAHVFALSSDTEQMPISVVEAMAAGLPVVSTKVGDVQRMVAEENRSYINGMRAKDLADALISLFGDLDEAARIGAINKEKAALDYTEDRMIDAWNAVFSGLSR